MNEELKLLDIIDYLDPRATELSVPGQTFQTNRRAVRAVVWDAQGQVYLLAVTAEGGYFKLPGGGVDPGETDVDALHREMKEELGYEIAVGAPVGRTIQYDHQDSYRQESLCYLATITGGSGQTSLTAEEQADGFHTVIFDDIDAAITAVEALRPASDHIYSVKRRELVLLQAAKAIHDSQT